MAQVNFISSTYAKYIALASKDTNTLYFIEDTKQIFKGTVDVTSSIEVLDSFPAVPSATHVEGKLYIHSTTFEMRIKRGSVWQVVSPGYIATLAAFTAGNDDKLSTIGATKAYIAKEIADVTGGTAFVKEITWDVDEGLQIDTGESTPSSVELTGLAHEVTYDSTNLKLTIPVYGGTDVVIDIPKDNFIRSGRYEADYELPGGGTGPAIVLTIGDGSTTSEVVIPAASLVDVYTGEATNTISVSVSEGNVITANVVIDPVAGNALISSPTGLKVDISGKANKLTAAASNHILVGSSSGDLSDSGTTIQTAGQLTASDSVPTSELVAEAISTAIAAAQQVTTSELEAITNAQHTGRLDVLETAVADLSGSILGEGDADEVVTSTTTGVKRSGKLIGGSQLAATPSANTLATEAAVADAISWKTLA